MVAQDKRDSLQQDFDRFYNYNSGTMNIHLKFNYIYNLQVTCIRTIRLIHNICWSKLENKVRFQQDKRNLPRIQWKPTSWSICSSQDLQIEHIETSTRSPLNFKSLLKVEWDHPQ